MYYTKIRISYREILIFAVCLADSRRARTERTDLNEER